jgi:hypothetical protein
MFFMLMKSLASGAVKIVPVNKKRVGKKCKNVKDRKYFRTKKKIDKLTVAKLTVAASPIFNP